MLVLAKAALSMMLGFILSIVAGLILIPLLKRIRAGQNVSTTIGERHLKKNGTPTLGGLIFIIPTIVTLLLLKLKGSIDISYNLLIILIVFIAYAALGFADDWLKIKFHNNKGLSILFKLACQMAIALVFFYIYITNGGSPVVEVSAIGLRLDLGWLYGIFILFLLVGSSNAVNITDGLDGLAGGLSAIAGIAFGLIAFSAGYEDIGIFCFILCGSLLGFLVFNTHPAKIFMGDTGSLALGAVLASIAILIRRELTLVIVLGVFIIETLSVILQVIWLYAFKKKLFLMSPLHHHFEKLGWNEVDIVKLFWVIGFILSMAGIFFGVWL